MLLKISRCEGFPNKVIVNRPANNNEFVQMNLWELKFKLSYLTSSKRNFGILSNLCVWTLSLGEVKATWNELW